MIEKITLRNVASYKQETTLETDKKINLIYGLNGVGKSIMSEYLGNPNNVNFSDCQISPLINPDETEILVYNQRYVEENFYDSPTLDGIFSLSKHNKEAKEAIDKAQARITDYQNRNAEEMERKKGIDDDFQNKRESAKNGIWAIKTDFTGGDRVLEYCLRGFMSGKNQLFDHIAGMSCPSTPIKDIDEIKKEVQILKSDAGKMEELPLISLIQRCSRAPRF